jgi:hypothetical protein
MSGLRLPHFIIGGAPRSSTTWLHVLADRHPAIAMAKPVAPEPKFFLVDELYEHGLGFYGATWFASLPPDRLLGEKSTNYLESARAAERIRRDLPEVKLVFLLRNPVDRAWSNYRWSRQNGLEIEDFATALSLEAQRDRIVQGSLRYARPHAYFSRGLYADLLTTYFALFPRTQLLVLRQEDAVRNPYAFVAKFHAFLGIEPRPQDADGLGKLNAAVDHEPLDATLQRQLDERYEEPNRRLQMLLGPEFEIWSKAPALSEPARASS